MAEEWRTAIVEGDPITKLTGKISVEQLASHASTHEYGGDDPVRNLDYLAIRNEKFIDENRKVVKDFHILKSNPQVTIEETEAETNYPQIDIKNPQRTWRIINSLAGHLQFYDVIADQLRHVMLYDTTSGSPQFIWYNSEGTELMRIDREGKASISGGLQVAGYDIITSDRKLKNISSIVQTLLPDADNTYDLGSSTSRWRDLQLGRNAYIGGDIFQTKTYPAVVLQETASATYYPRIDLLNPQRRWRILNDSAGNFRLIDATTGYSREISYYATAADSIQKRWYNSSGIEIMRIDYEGDLTITGKLTQGACPEFSKMSLEEIKNFLAKCRDKPEPLKDENGRFVCDICGKSFGDGCNNPDHYNQFIENHFHKTQEEVMALIHLVLNLAERVEYLMSKIK